MDFTKEHKNMINRKVNIEQAINRFITDDYEVEVFSDGWKRLNPCPFTSSTKNAFSLIEDEETGFQHYYTFSNNYNSEKYKNLPNSGTAADIVALFIDNNIDFWKFIKEVRGNKTIDYKRGNKNISKQIKSKKESIYTQKDLDKIQEKYLSQRTDQNSLYLYEERGYKEETLQHFQIGWDEDRKVYTYPSIVDGKIKHFRYKNKNVVYMLGNNNGGRWMFNEDALKENKVIFVEGEHDAMTIWQEMKAPVVAICGKFGERSEKHKVLKEKLKNKRIYLAFDNDEAGEEYRQYFIEHYSEDNEILTLKYEGKDPDDALKNGEKLHIVK